jgi:lysyl-tRNA synthetase class 2
MTMHKKGSVDNKTMISDKQKQETTISSVHYDIVMKRHELLKSIRRFFYDCGYIEVETANLMRTAPPDPHIDPLKVYIDTKGPFFLHTSPEMGMKKLLLSEHKRIFQICKVYRVEEQEEIHNTEFTMLEWYREGDYIDALQETNDLVSTVAIDLLGAGGESFQKQFDVYELERLFQEKTGISPFCLERDELFDAMRRKGFPGIHDGDDLSSLFFKLYVQEIEGTLTKDAPYFIIDWPTLISTMAKEKTGFPGKAERFELYIQGLEIANGYTELLDPGVQRKRFLEDNETRRRLGKTTFDVDETFLEALSMLKGSYAGVSVGVDRLMMALLGIDHIDNVIPNRFRKT